MAKLSTSARKDLDAKYFAGPGRSFPLTDKNHARAALADTPKAVKSGKITKGEAKAIDGKAKSKLGNFGGKAAKPFGGKAKAETSKAPAPKASRMSADDKELGMGNVQTGGKRGHNTYT